MKFPDAPPVFRLLTLQLCCVCGHWSQRFVVMVLMCVQNMIYLPFIILYTVILYG